MLRLSTFQQIRVFLYLFMTLLACSDAKKTTTQSSHSTSATPIVSSLKYYNHFSFNNVYTLDLKIGGETIEAVLDTGSSNLLAIGDSKTCSGCVNEYGYSSVYTPSPTSQIIEGEAWSMDFAPIGQATVHGYEDTVSFGGKTLDNYAFGVVTQEQGIPNIWGMAYATLAQPSGHGQLPLFDALVENAGLKNVFSLRLCGLKGGSQVTMGGYDAGLSSQELANVQWTPILQRVWYSVRLTSMYVSLNGTTADWQWLPSSRDTVIVDSGTNPLVLPGTYVSSLVTVLMKIANDQGVSIPNSFWPTSTEKGGLASISSSDVAKFPTIYLTMENFSNTKTSFKLSIAPSIYFQTAENGQRFLGIQPGSSIYLLGTVFMENYIVLHNRGTIASGTDPTAKLGFYPSSGFCK